MPSPPAMANDAEEAEAGEVTPQVSFFLLFCTGFSLGARGRVHLRVLGFWSRVSMFEFGVWRLGNLFFFWRRGTGVWGFDFWVSGFLYVFLKFGCLGFAFLGSGSCGILSFCL